MNYEKLFNSYYIVSVFFSLYKEKEWQPVWLMRFMNFSRWFHLKLLTYEKIGIMLHALLIARKNWIWETAHWTYFKRYPCHMCLFLRVEVVYRSSGGRVSLILCSSHNEEYQKHQSLLYCFNRLSESGVGLQGMTFPKEIYWEPQISPNYYKIW